MAVTLQQIAQKAGVSRGTVDRAMNNRGRINPEVADRIRQIAREMGYQPNRAGRALALAKKSIRIGVILQSTETPFMKIVLEGVMKAKEEVERLGASVTVKKIKEVDAGKAVTAMRRMRAAGCDGIALVAADDDRLKETIDLFAREGIPIVTFNSDAMGTERLCFVGQDAGQSGRTAGGLMAEILPPGGAVQVISGYESNRSHRDRTEAFKGVLQSSRQDVRVLDVKYAYDNDRAAEEITGHLLREQRDLSGIYLSAAGVEGVCRALEKQGLAGRVKVISNDLTEKNLEWLKRGAIQFLLGQDAYRQGYDPVIMLFDRLFDGVEPEKEYQYTEIVIKTRYNL